ncbi:hypothetical protein C8J56DRAFT_941521 [Mycena floridula]|nr:hypothetical protein C8J56DRAFT_941521 [Mycena floridula]
MMGLLVTTLLSQLRSSGGIAAPAPVTPPVPAPVPAPRITVTSADANMTRDLMGRISELEQQLLVMNEEQERQGRSRHPNLHWENPANNHAPRSQRGQAKRKVVEKKSVPPRRSASPPAPRRDNHPGPRRQSPSRRLPPSGQHHDRRNDRYHEASARYRSVSAPRDNEAGPSYHRNRIQDPSHVIIWGQKGTWSDEYDSEFHHLFYGQDVEFPQYPLTIERRTQTDMYGIRLTFANNRSAITFSTLWNGAGPRERDFLLLARVQDRE